MSTEKQIENAAIDMITFGTGAVIVTGDGGVEHQPMESIFELCYQAEVDIRESFRVPIEFLTRGSYE